MKTSVVKKSLHGKNGEQRMSKIKRYAEEKLGEQGFEQYLDEQTKGTK